MRRSLLIVLLLVALPLRALASSTTITLTADADDCYNTNAAATCVTTGGNVWSGHIVTPDEVYDGYYRFKIPSYILQSTITNVTFQCNWTVNVGTITALKVQAISGDQTTAPESMNPITAARVTNTVTWSSVTTSTTATSPDIKTLVQGANSWGASLANTTADHYIVIVLDDNGLAAGNAGFCMDSSNGSYSAYTKLNITYTVPWYLSALQQSTPARTPLAGSILDTATKNEGTPPAGDEEWGEIGGQTNQNVEYDFGTETALPAGNTAFLQFWGFYDGSHTLTLQCSADESTYTTCGTLSTAQSAEQNLTCDLTGNACVNTGATVPTPYTHIRLSHASSGNAAHHWYVDQVLVQTETPTPTMTFTVTPTFTITPTPTHTPTPTPTAVRCRDNTQCANVTPLSICFPTPP